MASLRLPAAGGGPKGGLGAIYLRVTTWDRVEWSAGGRLRERVLRAREGPAFFAEKNRTRQRRSNSPRRAFAALCWPLVLPGWSLVAWRRGWSELWRVAVDDDFFYCGLRGIVIRCWDAVVPRWAGVVLVTGGANALLFLRVGLMNSGVCDGLVRSARPIICASFGLS